jgi:type II secretory pathway pseudopilin PulG
MKSDFARADDFTLVEITIVWVIAVALIGGLCWSIYKVTTGAEIKDQAACRKLYGQDYKLARSGNGPTLCIGPDGSLKGLPR